MPSDHSTLIAKNDRIHRLPILSSLLRLLLLTLFSLGWVTY
jgi:hypothetical protein